MTQSEILYCNLLKFGSKRILDYLKNVNVYHSQFTFSDLNKSCFQEMYVNLPANTTYPLRQTFFETIPDLQSECKACYKHFKPDRNKSIKGYDVQLGKQIEEIFIDFMKSIGINIVRGDLKKRKLPDLLVLDNSKSIICHIELKYHAAPFVLTWRMRPGRECYEGSLTLDKDKIVKQLDLIYSELERPVFFVHWVDFPCVKGIFFQTSEQLHEMIKTNKEEFTRKEKEGDFVEKKDGTKRQASYLKKFYPSITEMGNFEELLIILKNNK